MAYLYLARAYWNLFNTNDGGLAFEQALKYSHRATERERLYIEETGYYYLDEKRYNTLLKLTERYPKEKRAHYKLGEYYLGKKLLAEAVKSFNLSLELDPEYEVALKQLAHTYMNIGDYDHALEIQHRYIDIFIDDAEPLVGLGNILFHMGKLDEAILNYEKALQIKPDFYTAYLKISYCYGLKSDYRKSLQWIEKYEQNAQSEGPMGEVMWWKAYYLKWLGQFNSSITESNNMIQLAQNFNEEYGVAMAKFLIASNYYENQEFQASKLYYKDAFDIFKQYSDTLFYKQCFNFFRGIIFLHERQMDSARILVNEIHSAVPAIKKQNPWREELMQILGQILEAEYILATGKAHEAVEVAKEILSEQIPLVPSMDFLFYNLALHNDILARAYIQSQEFEKAIEEYEQLTSFNPESNDRRLTYPLYHYNLAKLYRQKGLNDKAISQYEEFLRLWKNADTDRQELNEAKKQLELLNTN
jgi:tetratricopeptide (TPR) repeat protein